jgi:predicted nuclease of restriction endonuclease-like RecB superfamily
MQISVSEYNALVAEKKKTNLVKNSNFRGWFDFDGKRYYLKSKWELKYALYLEYLKKNNLIKDWEYEPDTFWFDKIKRGVRSYTPDFKVFKSDAIEYIEVKGYWDAKSLTKIKRMGIYHPEIKMNKVDKDFFSIANVKYKNNIWKGL